MSFRSTIGLVVRNMKETFLPKNWYAEKASFTTSRVCQRCQRCMPHALCKIMSKASKILKQAIIDFNEFIYFLSKMLKMCMNYNADSNMKSLNYSKIQFKPLIYFELQQSLNKNFELNVSHVSPVSPPVPSKVKSLSQLLLSNLFVP